MCKSQGLMKLFGKKVSVEAWSVLRVSVFCGSQLAGIILLPAFANALYTAGSGVFTYTWCNMGTS